MSSTGESKAIQWGMMGDVGMVQQTLTGNQHFNLGTVPQRTRSFLRTLNIFLQTPGAVFCSVVHAEKKDGDGSKGSLLSSILNVLGMLWFA